MPLIRGRNYLVDIDNVSHIHVDELIVTIFYKRANCVSSTRTFYQHNDVEDFLAMLVPKNKFIRHNDFLYLRESITKAEKISGRKEKNDNVPCLILYYGERQESIAFDTEAECDNFLEKL